MTVSNTVAFDLLLLGKRIVLAFLSLSGVVFFAFQKKLLSKPVSRIVSKLFFYPTFPFTILGRLGNYWTPIDDTIILGCAPMGFLGHPRALYRLGVRGVVNMCDEYSGPIDSYKDLNMQQLRLPTVDHFEPNIEQMAMAVKFIAGFKEKGEKVYIHCKAGHGRAASIALCWLIQQSPCAVTKDLNANLCKKRKVRHTLYKQPNIQAFAKAASEDELQRSLLPNTDNNDNECKKEC